MHTVKRKAASPVWPVSVYSSIKHEYINIHIAAGIASMRQQFHGTVVGTCVSNVNGCKGTVSKYVATVAQELLVEKFVRTLLTFSLVLL